MGTNYYETPRPPCACCGRGFKRKHIGKSSYGWYFALCWDPDNKLTSLEAWLERLRSREVLEGEGKAIVADGDPVTVAEFEVVVRLRGMERELSDEQAKRAGYTSLAHMLESNHAEVGENNLLRSTTRVGGGDYYDLIEGEFS